MAMTQCRECRQKVSTRAESCPHCGARVARKPMGCGTLIAVLILAPIIISVYSGLFSNDAGQSFNSSPKSTPSKPAKPKPPPEPGSQWTYRQSNDEMSGKKLQRATVESTNTVSFDFPYQGIQHGRLMLRTHPRWGKDIIFSIEKGQILCRSYEPCSVMVAFDDGAVERWKGLGPGDSSSTAVFIQDYHPFVEKLLKAKEVRIGVSIYEEGSPTFKFDVSNFSTDKYLPKN